MIVGRALKYVFVLAAVLFVCSFFSLLSQEITDNQIKTGLTVGFLRYITWENENATDTFTIGFYGDQDDFFNTLKTAEKQKIRNKAIKVEKFRSIGDINYCHVLIIANDRIVFIKDIYSLLRGKNTLIVSDGSDFPQFFSINFFHDSEAKVKFEINTQNINEARLKVSPRLVVLGGTEIDVRKLYAETEKTLISTKEKAEQYENELKQKEIELNERNNMLKNLTNNIDALQFSINKQKNELAYLNEKALEQQNELGQKTAILEQQRKKILDREKTLAQKDFDLQIKENQIVEYGNILDKQKQEIAKGQEIIDRQGMTLVSRDEQIKMQQNLMYLLISLVLVSLALIFAIYRNFRNNLKKNKEIQRQSDVLIEQSEHLQALNQELEAQKEELEETLEMLKGTQSQLVASEKMVILGQLTAGIAHEINNPINYINSGVDGFQQALGQIIELVGKYGQITSTNVDEKIREIESFKLKIGYNDLLPDMEQLMADIKMGVHRTIEIIKGLRTFSRLDETDLKTVNVHECIESTLIILRNKYSNRIDIVKNYGKIPPIECYAGKINQVLLNILVNAVQAIKGNGKIDISTRTVMLNNIENIEIIIKDSGPGIPRNILNRIFEPFFTTKASGEGTGLGLSISHSIIENHRGHIEVDSFPGEGATFRITLPVIFHPIQNPLTFHTT